MTEHSERETDGRRPGRVLLAWGVHFYTGLGLVAAAGIAVLLVRGGHDSFRLAFLLMIVATVVDATDGTLARAVRVKEVLPGFDGRRLDDLVDFLNYTFLPLLLIWRAGLLPEGQEGWLLLPLLASAYGFCQVSAKTEDGYFLGFPSYWNVVAFYLYALDLPGPVSLGLVVALALLTFVPSRYLYPTQNGRLNRWTNALAVPWAPLLFYLAWEAPPPDMGGGPPVWASLYFPLYYMAASWAVTLNHWRRDFAAKAPSHQAPSEAP